MQLQLRKVKVRAAVRAAHAWMLGCCRILLPRTRGELRLHLVLVLRQKSGRRLLVFTVPKRHGIG